nr:metal-dependent hydrolase [Liquorilactobacillus vini]
MRVLKVIWHGHATLEIVTANHQDILIDPFITGNPLTDLKLSDCHPDYILLTHAHADHVGDTLKLAQKNQATVIAIVELANYFAKLGLKTIGLNYGGQYRTDFGSFKLVPAWHTSSLPQADNSSLPLGNAAGFELRIDDKIIYDAGDTCLFSDMKLINHGQGVDLACLPIGDHFTMGPEDAMIAAEFVKAVHVLPIHYNTFTAIKQDVNQFLATLPTKVGLKVKPGEEINL